VMVHGRSQERAAAAVERIGGGQVVVADLASFAQLRALVDEVVRRFGRLHGLVNNAGIGYNTAPPRGERTNDGHEPTWQVNFLSAFLLTMGLQDPLVAGRGRVVHMKLRGPLERQRRPRAAGRAALCQPVRAVEARAGDACA
jgi:NAD(P)-dependent dehydrogenase (short-subunit alcohol dehydrogenase family)